MERGRTVTQAVAEVAAEKPKKKPGPRTTGDVVTRDVDLFKQHGVKPGRVAWGKTRTGAFAASAGKTSVVMEPSEIAGAWRVVTISERGDRAVVMDNVPLGLATGVAEDQVRRHGDAKLTDRKAKWRKDAPTDQQKAFAQKLGIGIPATATKGDVSAMIDARMAEIRASKARL